MLQADTSIGALIVQGGIGAIVVLQGIILKRTGAIGEIERTLAKWDGILFGANGDNGLNGSVKMLRMDVDGLLRDRRQMARRVSDIPDGITGSGS